MNNPILAVLNHWVHLVSAIALLGGTITLRLAVHPSLKTLDAEASENFQRAMRRKMAMLIHAPFLLLIITGLVNYARRSADGMGFAYNMVFLIKFLLAMAVFGIALALTIPSEALAAFQARRPHWLMVNILLGLVVVLLSAWLRMMKVG